MLLTPPRRSGPKCRETSSLFCSERDHGRGEGTSDFTLRRRTKHVQTSQSPKKLDELLFAELVDLAAAHFNPKPSPIVKRYKFNSRCQREGESIATYIAELRKIVEHCEYGAVLSDMLRDRLVCGTNHKGIQRHLLLGPGLTFDKTIRVGFGSGGC